MVIYFVHAAVSATPHKKQIIAGMNVELQLVVTIITSSDWLYYT